ncbi:hypothetical protein WA026_020843 [Henosepilachna vigintioctopunctata]|uniref:Damage-control phosphatase ARMT1-like metal-binding domain-containing protein n=1 Tax=Henosepilachna vigintioctopunctata TaxID=420089 RepID=A0AAW1TXN6_9CUCU
MDVQTSICPLLRNPRTYDPDTIDLLNDIKQRDYWLTCLHQMMKKFITKAAVLNPEDLRAEEKAKKSYQSFHMLTEKLKDNPHLLNPLNVRTLLEFDEDNLRDNNFKDDWYHQKQKKTNLAFQQFLSRLKVLAGNVFDWGSKAVSDILDGNPGFDLNNAVRIIQPRPSFKDNFDSFVDKIKTFPYEEVVIFVDNAGIDFVLVIIPLTRELQKLDTKVILVGNSMPALNDEN